MVFSQTQLRILTGLVILATVATALIGGILLTTYKDASKYAVIEAERELKDYTPTVAFTAKVVVDKVLVQADSGFHFPVIASIDEQISVRVLGVNNTKTWLFILLPDNQQGWIPIDAVEYDFDINLIPVIKETPQPPKPYGAMILVPPQLSGVSPGTQNSPARSILSLVAISGLTILIASASNEFIKRKGPNRFSFLRIIYSLISTI
jgi:hypothetical protein